jgi:hypothetical protein
MLNFVLNKQGYPMLDIPYSGRNRLKSYTALERAQIRKVDTVFIQWFIRSMKENDAYLNKTSTLSLCLVEKL